MLSRNLQISMIQDEEWTTKRCIRTKWHTCTMRAKWHSAASSSPCFSAHISTRRSLRISRWPVALVHRLELWAISRLNSHWLMKWKSCENSWIVSAAFTLARSSSDIVHDNRLTTSSVRQMPEKYQHKTNVVTTVIISNKLIKCKKPVVYIHLKSDMHDLYIKNYKKVILPIITSPKCQCAAE